VAAARPEVTRYSPQTVPASEIELASPGIYDPPIVQLRAMADLGPGALLPRGHPALPLGAGVLVWASPVAVTIARSSQARMSTCVTDGSSL
jgi:hypothetical protein